MHVDGAKLTVRQAGRLVTNARLEWEPLSEWGVEDHGFRAQLPTEQDISLWLERDVRGYRQDWRLYLCGENPAPGHADLDKADEFLCRGTLLECLVAGEDCCRRILRAEANQLGLFGREP